MSSIDNLIRQTTMSLIDSNVDNSNIVDGYDRHHQNLPSSSSSLTNDKITINTLPNGQIITDNDQQQQQQIEQTFDVSNELIAKNFAKYYPEEANFWMYAMIVLGFAFIVFVAITIYKLCQPENDGRFSKSKSKTKSKQKRSESVPGVTVAGIVPSTTNIA
uniref:Uncharacterized protein LOC113799105 n=1 Tax=Dermatophagoides pteronyssinus TaxID=6956 RepID=A0A6P6YJU0_DERPT|nr:uncharacterized protein LOC113799105 [Dermatophagoides pteronyssinus]